jgi:hypothetical protein
VDTFKLVTPNMSSSAIGAFQGLLNERFKAWQIDIHVDDDEQYGGDTDHAARQVCHGLGLSPNSYRDGMTPGVRTKIRHPDRRTAAEVAVGEQRKDWRAALRKAVQAAEAGPKKAIAYGRAHVGVSEDPPNSNRGPLIDKWNRAVNTPPGPMAFWCGAFVNACLHAGGLLDEPFLASCPQTETTARGGTQGWSWHAKLADGKPGDLVLYTEPSMGSVAAHVELIVTVSPFDVLGGNTSANPASGNPTNGGCVAENRRDPNNPGLKFKGYARPPWPK